MTPHEPLIDEGGRRCNYVRPDGTLCNLLAEEHEPDTFARAYHARTDDADGLERAAAILRRYGILALAQSVDLAARGVGNGSVRELRPLVAPMVPIARRPRGGQVRPCPCECNSGGFCGGCGHAGCSGGVNVR